MADHTRVSGFSPSLADVIVERSPEAKQAFHDGVLYGLRVAIERCSSNGHIATAQELTLFHNATKQLWDETQRVEVQV